MRPPWWSRHNAPGRRKREERSLRNEAGRLLAMDYNPDPFIPQAGRKPYPLHQAPVDASLPSGSC